MNNFPIRTRGRLLTLLAAGALLLSACDGRNSAEYSSGGTDSTDARMQDPATRAEAENPDLEFYEDAALNGLAEVQMAQLAVDKATNAEVKQFAQQMIADHQKANQELQALAQRKDVRIPSRLSDNLQNDLNDLRDKAGAEFDDAYMQKQVDAHQKAVSVFEREAENGEDLDARAWAQKTLPTLRQHLDHAKRLDEQVDA